MHYLNDRWVKTEDLVVSAFDLAVVRGFGVFDFLRTYANKPFLLKEHLDRFYNSAHLLELTIPKTKKELEKTVYEGIRKNAFPETNIRLILTGGVSNDSLTVNKPSLLIIFTEGHRYPDERYTKGVKVISYNASRMFPMAKSLNYMMAIIALQKARKQGALEAIYTEKGVIYEGTTSNFFVVIEGVLVTPKKDVLSGVTRELVIRLAKKIGLPVEERALHASEMAKFDEAFITASNKEIMPVVAIDDRKVGDGRVGTVTKKLMKEFKAFISGIIAT